MGVPSLPRQARMSLRRARWASKMRKFDRITSNPHVLSGQPCIRDMRLTVRRVVEAVAAIRTEPNCWPSTPNSRMRTFVRRWNSLPVLSKTRLSIEEPLETAAVGPGTSPVISGETPGRGRRCGSCWGCRTIARHRLSGSGLKDWVLQNWPSYCSVSTMRQRKHSAQVRQYP